MKWTYLVRRFGLDGNPLRRRSDKISVGLVAGAMAVFLIGAPFLAAATASWAGHAATAKQQAQHSWRQVPAVLLKDATARESLYGGYFYDTWVQARWSAPDGRVRTGEIPVALGIPAGQRVPLWVDTSGTPTGPPMAHRAASVSKVFTAAFAVVTLGVALVYLAFTGCWLLDRHRLAGWESEWAAIEPQWTRRFWSRG